MCVPGVHGGAKGRRLGLGPLHTHLAVGHAVLDDGDELAWVRVRVRVSGRGRG